MARTDRPIGPSVEAQLEAVIMTPLQRQRARRNLRPAERLVDLLLAIAAGVRRLRGLAILDPVAGWRRRHRRWPGRAVRTAAAKVRGTGAASATGLEISTGSRWWS